MVELLIVCVLREVKDMMKDRLRFEKQCCQKMQRSSTNGQQAQGRPARGPRDVGARMRAYARF